MNVTDINDELVEYMQNKYGAAYDDKFVLKEMKGAHFGESVREIILASERYPDAKIVAKYSGDNGVERFSDNYMAFVYEDKINEAIKQSVQKVYGKCKSYYLPSQSALPADIGPETTLEEFMADVRTEINAVIFVEASDMRAKEELLEKLRRELKEKRIILRANLIYINEGSPEEITWEKYRENFEKNVVDDVQCIFSLDEEYEFLYVDWR